MAPRDFHGLTGRRSGGSIRGAVRILRRSSNRLLCSQENLKKIGGAFHDFQTANLMLPRDMLAADGTPLHSLRVAILPHLGEEELFKQFKLHEPWDSEHNKKLIPKIPTAYETGGGKRRRARPSTTSFGGKTALFGPESPSSRIPGSTPDGTSGTGLVFEAGQPGAILDQGRRRCRLMRKAAPQKLGGMFDGEFNVLPGGSLGFARQEECE